ncbi:MAG: DNA polymerase III subunit gamma/tau [Patescibacteria group bacterium]|jgi:DNA polymerase-3 subunit gamma/tau
MSLSRRYRPQTFADVTDQDNIKETLRKEVATGKIAHAYLFSGPRGVGKTTTARIFAKALNCEKKKNGEPCNACGPCTEANEGRLLDLIEMDAASNTGVDNIREAIVEHVRFHPSRAAYKVYILDEAHMLSNAAWNALLKTLEEPPSYAVFILATTERHKVPATIVSRCQQFDFKRIPDEPLAERVRVLAKNEGVTVDGNVVTSIVRHSDGCVRDAETLLGQIVALGEKNITVEIASLVIPISRLPVAANLLDVCSRRELGPALAEVARLEEEGLPMLPLFDDLLEAVRQLLIAGSDKKMAERLATGDEGEKRLVTLIDRYAAAELGDIALMLMERRRDAKQGADPRFAMELAVTAITLGILPHGPRSGGGGTAVVKSEPIIPKVVSTQPAPPIAETVIEKPVEQSIAPSIPAEPGIVTLAQAQRAWPVMVKTLSETGPSLAFVLKTSRPIETSGSVITIRFQYPFHRDKILNDIKNRRLVENAYNKALKMEGIHLEGLVGEDAQVTEKRSADMVSNILKAFGGQVVEETGDA